MLRDNVRVHLLDVASKVLVNESTKKVYFSVNNIGRLFGIGTYSRGFG